MTKTTKKFTITEHAYERAKERLSWRRKTLNRMAKKAFYGGLKHKDTKGKLNKYISNLYLQYRTANNIRIYGENVYFFTDCHLITLYRMPQELIKYLKYCR